MENTYNEDFYIPKDKLSKSQKLVRYYFKNMGSLFPNSSKRLFWKLFTTPRKRKPSTSQQEFIKKAVSVSIKTQLLSTVYYAHHFGQGNKIVLLCHGWEGMTADFKGLIDFFISNNYKVISLDFPGHGASPKSQAHLPLFIDVIKDFITFHSNNIQFTSLIGHSLGAAALSLAIPDMDKDRFERVILLGLHPKPSDFILQYKSITQIKSTLFTKCIQYAEKKS